MKGRYWMGMPAQQVSPPDDTAQWPCHSFLPLGALPGAVPCARLHTTAVLWEWGMESLVQAAELAVSELVTNAVRASVQARSARPPGSPTGLPVVGLRLAGDRQRLLVEVSDHDPGPPVPTAVDPERDGGRGLLLVEAVSERWGYYYPASDSVAPRRSPVLAASAPQFLAAPPLLPAPAEPGKIVWALLLPGRLGRPVALCRRERLSGGMDRKAELWATTTAPRGPARLPILPSWQPRSRLDGLWDMP